MSLQVIDFQQEEATAKSRRLDKLNEAFYAATRAVDNELHRRGILPRENASCDQRATGFDALRSDEQMGWIRVRMYYDGQIQKYQKMLKRALASDSLNEEDRLHILRGVSGSRAAAIESKPLSNEERECIARYRAMEAEDRQVFRTLLKRLSECAADRLGPQVDKGA